MHRPWMRRAAAALLIVWTSASLGKRAVFDHCPQHDPLAAAMAGMAPGGAADAHAPGGHSKKHHCCCLEGCGAVSAFALPEPVVGAVIAAALPTGAPAAPPRRNPPARVDTRPPFANRPPHTSAA
jgi:hypothetical protein